MGGAGSASRERSELRLFVAHVAQISASTNEKRAENRSITIDKVCIAGGTRFLELEGSTGLSKGR
jgi:hypothetical protein